MADLKPAQREKLQAVCNLIADRQRAGVDAAAIVAELVRDHGARYDTRWDANRLRVAGISASCTWSKDAGLLSNWSKTATLRLAAAAMETVHA